MLSWSKPRRSTSASTTSTTATSATLLGTGSDCAFAIAPQRPYMWSPRGSYGLTSTGRTASQPSSTMSPTALSFLLMPGCTTSSTTSCRRSLWGLHPLCHFALAPTHHGATQPVPERATHTRLARRVWQVLVHWQGEPAASARRTLTASSTVI
jgi:hypothetical protein